MLVGGCTWYGCLELCKTEFPGEMELSGFALSMMYFRNFACVGGLILDFD